MALEKIEKFEGQGVYLPENDIDTDRIIPARFMVCVTFEGLGKYAFYDERKNADGTDKDHVLNKPEYKNANIILAESFAEIFFGNATTLGIPCVTASHDDIKKIADEVVSKPDSKILIDLKAKKISCNGVSVDCQMPENARQALMTGTWDPIAELMEADTDKVYNSLCYTK